MTRRAADIVFVEALNDSWYGRPLCPRNTSDACTGRPFEARTFRAWIRELPDGWYETTRQARSKHGRRTDLFRTYPEAQASLVRWFQRNFKITSQG